MTPKEIYALPSQFVYAWPDVRCEVINNVFDVNYHSDLSSDAMGEAIAANRFTVHEKLQYVVDSEYAITLWVYEWHGVPFAYAMEGHGFDLTVTHALLFAEAKMDVLRSVYSERPKISPANVGKTIGHEEVIMRRFGDETRFVHLDKVSNRKGVPLLDEVALAELFKDRLEPLRGDDLYKAGLNSSAAREIAADILLEAMPYVDEAVRFNRQRIEGGYTLAYAAVDGGTYVYAVPMGDARQNFDWHRRVTTTLVGPAALLENAKHLLEGRMVDLGTPVARDLAAEFEMSSDEVIYAINSVLLGRADDLLTAVVMAVQSRDHEEIPVAFRGQDWGRVTARLLSENADRQRFGLAGHSSVALATKTHEAYERLRHSREARDKADAAISNDVPL
jgi:hypothetical protein